uniref:Uncharacterized protein n=1 Tax=Cacopsylla melanoneura TaxID=428564 RepID=A0A8D8RJ99_9HEMI
MSLNLSSPRHKMSKNQTVLLCSCTSKDCGVLFCDISTNYVKLIESPSSLRQNNSYQRNLRSKFQISRCSCLGERAMSESVSDTLSLVHCKSHHKENILTEIKIAPILNDYLPY